MSANSPLVFESGPWEIDVGQRQLRLRGVPVQIGSRAFDIVEKLVRSEGQYRYSRAKSLKADSDFAAVQPANHGLQLGPLRPHRLVSLLAV